MEIIKSFIINYNIEVITGLIVTNIVLLILTLISQFRISSITKKYSKLVRGTEGTALDDILIENLEETRDIQRRLVDIKEYCKQLEGKFKLSIQKIGFIRYNAFNDMGSDLSFSLALLNEDFDGVIISSIYGRNECNTYGKPVVKGKSNYKLSVEELQALNKAKKYGEYKDIKNNVS